MRAVDARSPFDHIEIQLEDAALAEDEFSDGDERGFSGLAENGAAGSEEEVLDELLREGGCAAKAVAFHVLVGGDLDLVPIEAVVLVEACIFSGDYGVLKVWRYLAEGDELVARVVGLVVDEGLEAALDVDGRGGRVDKAGGNEREHRKEPAAHDGDDEPAEERAEESLVGGFLRAAVKPGDHISGYLAGRFAEMVRQARRRAPGGGKQGRVKAEEFPIGR